jgi:hypothetical protein
MAVASEDGVRLWDVAGAKQIAFWAMPGLVSALFHPDGRSLITTGAAGLQRWPIASDATAGPLGLRIDSPQTYALTTFHSWAPLSLAADGRTVAVTTPRPHNEAVVLDLQTGEVRFRGEHPGASVIAISPDGRWLASTPWWGDGLLRVWDLQRDEKAWTMPAPLCTVAFTPDSRSLMIGLAGEYQIREVGTWRLIHRIGRDSSELHGPAAFARDGSMMAIVPAIGQISLIGMSSFEYISTFTSPASSSSEPQRIAALAFSPDGTRLAAACWTPHAVQLWDLRLIRCQLAAMGLDWDAPAFPAASARTPSGPLKVTVHPGALASTTNTPEAIVDRQTARLKDHPDDAEARHQRGHALFRLKRFDEAIADCEAALRLKPDRGDRGPLAELCNNLAWTLATGPASTPDSTRALNLARRAVELIPDRAIYLNTLGVAQYRAGQYVESVATLEKSLAAGKGATDAFDLFFLAMARFRLGLIARARADFDRALRWRCDHGNLSAQWNAELDAFQAEAQSLLDGPPPDLPDDVFASEPPNRP